MTERMVYTLRWDKAAGEWMCLQLSLRGENKIDLIRIIATRLARRWKYARQPCQLKIYKRNGQIQSERTYGMDPKRYPG